MYVTLLSMTNGQITNQRGSGAASTVLSNLRAEAEQDKATVEALLASEADPARREALGARLSSVEYRLRRLTGREAALAKGKRGGAVARVLAESGNGGLL